MNNVSEELIKKLSESVVEMEEEETVELAKECIENNISAYEAIDKGLAHGMNRAGELYEEGEYYIPELLMCSDAMYSGLEVLKPHLKKNDLGKKHKIVIGVIQGDTHDIGKNLVKIMMETEGFEVIDLGRDVPPRDFVDKAKEIQADIICMSTLMTTTMDGMEEVIKLLKEEGIRDKVTVMIGGGPISQNFADKIGADVYTTDASRAAKRAKKIVEEKVKC
ncbi:dimethylamine corrinoid protein [Clostridium botulinum]|uniref:Dimethylamine corrinoid protein n=1 Tax=Clostridium botulinum (strain Hall / ATCC 3502 / NCTC 13319 / Type A) TaxID=441771 RepID=A5I1X2_CLOBH|nr:corrinoid protein [Clostridium botulinum]ABS33309.1 dimethylamine corrinoid protein [Clostridium botulinum A str. ATCC 19397]ABS36381.1 dimethylamine corrinoid protein [Clostridium botulinum A str. Hall]APH21080.1 methyltransferase cognate corrinoid s, Methanosarcina family domain protein [Clostridium botulinum]APQ69195.1 methyltransferase cognate corrinoid s, Methanosarcina family domain protein [Clostridium botulinum]APQ74272.1 methyltransferase cognate corrinoid s, Methanosarcina family 